MSTTPLSLKALTSSTSRTAERSKIKDYWAWVTSLPDTPYQNFHSIKVSGISQEDVRVGVNVLAFFTDAINGKAWAAELGRRLNMTEVNVREVDGGSLEAEVVIETTMTDGMSLPSRARGEYVIND